MKKLIILRIQVLLILLGLSTFSYGQLYSPGRDWADTTQYSKIGAKQDSIFVFFYTSASPQKGKLKARFSDGSISNFNWYKYNPLKTVSARYELYNSESGVTESNLTNLDGGGYKVSVTSGAVTEDYYCWLMIDNVTLTTISIDNRCDFLELVAKTNPSALTIYNNNVFKYWDLSRTNQPEINTLGNNYFKNLAWHASNSEITVSSDPSLTLTISDPAPLYDSKYDVRIINPFGRVLTSETDLIVAKATKADFLVYTDIDGTWSDGGSTPSGEAPLKLKLESKSINADSIYWHIINDAKLFKLTRDSIIWRDSALFTERVESYPTPEKMVPGHFPVEHISVKESSGCRDTMTIYVDVDTSAFKTDAIPNVFTPNGDNQNDYFKIKEVKTNVISIKTFHVHIFNRDGRVIYEYSGNPKSWEGWNGKIDGNKGDAAVGVYYYIIEAVGWDNKKYRGGTYKGFLYLLRGK